MREKKTVPGRGVNTDEGVHVGTGGGVNTDGGGGHTMKRNISLNSVASSVYTRGGRTYPNPNPNPSVYTRGGRMMTMDDGSLY